MVPMLVADQPDEEILPKIMSPLLEVVKPQKYRYSEPTFLLFSSMILRIVKVSPVWASLVIVIYWKLVIALPKNRPPSELPPT